MNRSKGAEEIVEAASAAVTAVKELGPSLAEELMHETMSSESSSGKCLSSNLKSVSHFVTQSVAMK